MSTRTAGSGPARKSLVSPSRIGVLQRDDKSIRPGQAVRERTTGRWEEPDSHCKGSGSSHQSCDEVVEGKERLADFLAIFELAAQLGVRDV